MELKEGRIKNHYCCPTKTFCPGLAGYADPRKRVHCLPTPTLGKGRQVVHHSQTLPPEVQHDRGSSCPRSLLRTAPLAASPRQQLQCTSSPSRLQQQLHSPTVRCGPTSSRRVVCSRTISPGTRALRPASTPALPAQKPTAFCSPDFGDSPEKTLCHRHSNLSQRGGYSLSSQEDRFCRTGVLFRVIASL